MAVNKAMHILVVEEHGTARRIVKNLLKQIGFDRTDEAGGGEEALAMLRKKPYGLIISDWSMQPMSGLELLKQVRADDALKAIPFIMVATESAPENVLAAKQAGVNNYIVKPLNAKTLKSKISAILGDF